MTDQIIRLENAELQKDRLKNVGPKMPAYKLNKAFLFSFLSF